MKIFSRLSKRLIIAALTLVLMSGALLTSSGGGPTRAKGATSTYPMYSKEITYYSDASYTTVIGYTTIYCNGTGYHEGGSSAYHTEEILDICCNGVPC